MKTVLFVSHASELNGAELFLLETLRRLDRRAFRPVLALARPGPLAAAAESAGVETRLVPAKWWLTEKGRVWRQPAAWLLNRASVRRLVRVVREERADLVFSNSAATFGGALAAAKAGVPHVWSVHELLRGRNAQLRYLFGPSRLGRFILRRSARVIVNSEATRSSLPASDKIALVYNGVEIRPGDPAREDSLRRRFGLAEGDPSAAVIGKIYPGKGQREAVEAVSLLADKHPRLKLFLVGGVRDGEYAESIRLLVRSRGLEGRVVFAGYLDDLSFFLRLMAAVVVASTVESFGRAALEGMAAGAAVLAVRSGGLAEVVEDGVNGLLAPSASPEDLAARLDLILRDSSRRQKLVEGGFKTVREKFSLARQVAGVERILAEVLGGTLLVPPPLNGQGPFFARKGEPSS
ncbi:MAG: glycosyltransferase family 4 protein [Candidatus Aminicenantes bacterium]|nr:glycosyltransferase family 4 protein [Candidatus Aminicenantes bacterium]